MRLSFQTALLTLNSLILPMAGASNTDLCPAAEGDTFVVERLTLSPQTIFDVTATDTLALHRWANNLHVTTRPAVIAERLPFRQGDTISLDDLREAEALLRQERFIANAVITVRGHCSSDEVTEVEVSTFDNWSLIPTLSFSRSGGENRLIVGAREDNLFGWGIRTQLRYTDDEQRSGLQLGITSALHWVKHATITASFADNNDGKRVYAAYNKPFYHLATTTSHALAYGRDERIQTLFQNDEVRNRLRINERSLDIAYGWVINSDNVASTRLIAGFHIRDAAFDFSATSPAFDPELRPYDRAYRYPWLAIEYLQRNIIVKQNINLIGQPEDINTGWKLRLQLGVETHDVDADSDVGYQLSASASRAFDGAVWLVLFSTQFDAILNTTAPDYLRFSWDLGAFYQHNETLSYYTRLSGDFSSGQFRDQPIVIDDDNGVRGFANQYQHGDHRLSASAEVRLHTGVNFYQLFNLGFAAFVDVGRAFHGDAATHNEDTSTLASVGIGARLYSNKASKPGVIHLDITKPFGEGEGVDTLAWGLQFRRSF